MTRTRERAPKQWAVMVIIDDRLHLLYKWRKTILWTSPALQTHNECNAIMGLVWSWLSGPHLSWLSGPHLSWLSGPHLSWLSGPHLSWLSGSHLSWLSGPHLSWLSGPHLSWLSGPHTGQIAPFVCSAVSMFNITHPYLLLWRGMTDDCYESNQLYVKIL